ncbi:hypothetical protein YH65_09495 [Sulfurovum lithotrophicum]|uniref:Ferredoxin--nitrite reductase n=1 Tax=Sulfurovum lithotrophicum TaxID=206403 RepID=A0A7U4M2D2_9BACT|nr:nitrite/sulfite reductase [Sulfurovum lithotrophicum]AKF25585.1 hypothetical protein YH65_09495 [Sulfurovum lithotrophicum]
MKPNKIERLKSEYHPYDFREKIFYLDLEDLSEEDRFYLKNWGIYNIKLMPEKFMLRIRIAGGRAEADMLSFLFGIAREYHLELLVTARAQIELHGLNAYNVLEVWQKLQNADITTLQTLTDNFRNIVTDPYDGVTKENRVEVYSLIMQMQTLFLNKEAWMGMLPRKFNVAISGTQKSHLHFFGNDLYFALAKKKGEWGFNLYLGGKNSEVARKADIFVLPHNVPPMFEALSKVYNAYGLRGSRAKTRLFHLLSEIGMTAFVEKIAEFYPYAMEKAGALQHEKCTFTSFVELKDGTFGYCYQTHFGKIGLKELEILLNYARKESLQIRLGVDQNIYLLGLKEKSVPFETDTGSSHIVACAGSAYCGLSLWDVKAETTYLPLKKIEQHNIQVGFSGCLKGCGRHHHADIGLVGLRTNVFGDTQKAARVFLGGEYSSGKAAARLIFHAVPLQHLSSLLEVIIEEFETSGVSDFERFCGVYMNPHSSNFVALWFLAKLYLKVPIRLEVLPEAKLYEKLLEHSGFPKPEEDENYIESIKIMMHALWDDALTRTS